MKNSSSAAYIPARKGGKVVAGQLALIHVAKNKLALSDEDYRAILGQYGVSSSKELTMAGFEQVMAHMERLGFSSIKVEKGHGQNAYRAADTHISDPKALKTPAQENRLAHYFETLGWHESERRRNFCQRMIKKPWPQTRDEAAKVIEALKSMVARNYKRQ